MTRVQPPLRSVHAHMMSRGGVHGRGGSRILKVVVHPKQLTVLALDLQT